MADPDRRQAITYPQLVGQIVKYHRKHHGLQLAPFCAKLEMPMTPSGWSRVESGETTMTVVQLRKAAKALGVSCSALLKGAEELELIIIHQGVCVVDGKPRGEGENSAWWLLGGTTLFALVVAIMNARQLNTPEAPNDHR